ncbi:penicillin acylase family protein [bacterium]|nr:penicillin acylase family protein [bacterium]
MKKVLFLFSFILVSCSSQTTSFTAGEVAAWESRADSVTVVRDEWGIPHIYGKTDADVVFGMLYAQAEDDFNRIEVNFLNAMGRLAEAEGESEIYRDLRMKLFIDPVELKQMYDESPEWLTSLMNAWADGLNYYLYTHPEVKPRVLDRFEPWMALSFSEGSIGGDIERVSIRDLETFYGGDPASTLTMASNVDPDFVPEPTGSNGFAIAPSNTKNGNALLLINPHTSFYFRAEVHMVSEEGLNAYGAVTWGQFFVYQGFNEKTGWMHTSSAADNMDEFLETIVEKSDGMYYLYDGEELPLESKVVTVSYKDGSSLKTKDFTVYRSQHGPIIRAEDGKWLAFKIMEEPLKALQQSYLRTKAQNYDEFYSSMEYHTNSSNNTVYADADGNIVYFHSNFIPVRDPSFDYTRPVDGSISATNWKGLHSIGESILVKNPENGWIQNTNNWPFSVTGDLSPKQADFPQYMNTTTENARGLHALRVLEGKKDFTIESLRAAAYDSYLTAFDETLPNLFKAYDSIETRDSLKQAVSEQVTLLRNWDQRFGEESVATSVAIMWATELQTRARNHAREGGVSLTHFLESGDHPEIWLESLLAAKDKLERDFGSWSTPWGEINRFQRLTGDIVQPFDDSQPSIPVGFTSATWGSLAAYGQRTFNDTKKIYGTRGNSFVAIVEFGDSLNAIAVTAGGQSGDPASPHFNDQAPLYASGQLRHVYFYKSDIEKHQEESYNPGSRK